MAEVSTAPNEVELLGKNNGPVAWVQYAAARGILGGIGRMPRGLQTLYVSVLAHLARRFDARHTDAKGNGADGFRMWVGARKVRPFAKVEGAKVAAIVEHHLRIALEE